ncbi:MAG TPA: hypothetical protein VH331_19230 [Allosphingosinicella sp.]|jgi:hypothetical protein|nr:hypothetical protein [Allosphingosinicella sp.]
MSEKPAAPDQEGVRPTPDDAPRRKDEDFRQLCRNYSRIRARLPR